MEFKAEYSSNLAAGLRADADAVKALRTELEANLKSLKDTEKAAGAAGKSAAPQTSKPSGGTAPSFKAFDSDEFKLGVIRAQARKEQEQKARKELEVAQRGGRPAAYDGATDPTARRLDEESKKKQEAQKKASTDAKKTSDERRRTLDKYGGSAAGAGGTVSGGAKMAVGAVAAAAGAAGVADLAKLALGIRGQQQLQQVMARTAFQGRMLFKGVDSSGAVKAADRFFNSILNPASASGKALHGLAERGVAGVSAAMEKLQPLATGLFQGVIIGALDVEIAFQKARIALFPFTDAITDSIGPMEAAEDAALAGELALEGLAIAAGAAAAPFVVMAGAITLAVDQYRRLKKEMGANGEGEKAKLNAGISNFYGEGSTEANRAYGINGVSADEAAATHAKFLASQAGGAAGAGGGAASGAEYAAGVVAGIDAGGSAVSDAGGRLAGEADGGFRAGAKIQSPSKVAYDSAGYIPAGVVNAIDDGRADVQAAADGLVPKMPGGAGGGRGGASGGGRAGTGAKVEISVSVVLQGTGKANDDMRAVARRVFNEELAAALMTLGISPTLSAGGAPP